jgi:hypothetical protein
MSFTTCFAYYKVFKDEEGGTLNEFREASTSAEGGHAPMYFPGTEGDYVGGILDLWELQEQVEPDSDSSPYAGFMKLWADIIPRVPY